MFTRNDIERLDAEAGEARRACRQLADDLEAVASDPVLATPDGAVLAWALEHAMSAAYSAGRALDRLRDLGA